VKTSSARNLNARWNVPINERWQPESKQDEIRNQCTLAFHEKRKRKMKTNLVVAGLCLASALGIGIAQAQSGTFITVNIPYASNVGSNALPAGEYTVREIQQIGNSAVLEFSSRTTGQSFNVMAVEVAGSNQKTGDRSEVVLKSDGEKYQVWLGSHNYGYQLVTSR
jgi:hypothetical protein